MLHLVCGSLTKKREVKYGRFGFATSYTLEVSCTGAGYAKLSYAAAGELVLCREILLACYSVVSTHPTHPSDVSPLKRGGLNLSHILNMLSGLTNKCQPLFAF